MDNLVFNKLKLHNYIYIHKNEVIPVYEAKNLFIFRMRVDKFKENFGENYEDKSCPVCKLQLDTQVRSVQCEKVKDGIKIGGEMCLQIYLKHSYRRKMLSAYSFVLIRI